MYCPDVYFHFSLQFLMSHIGVIISVKVKETKRNHKSLSDLLSLVI